jgi:hypothetical protein
MRRPIPGTCGTLCATGIAISLLALALGSVGCDDAVCPTGTKEVNARCVRQDGVAVAGEGSSPTGGTGSETLSGQAAQSAGAGASTVGGTGGLAALGMASPSGNGGVSGTGASAVAGMSMMPDGVAGYGASPATAGMAAAVNAAGSPSAGTDGSSSGSGSATSGSGGAMTAGAPCTPTEETCDGDDNDCDGRNDEDIEPRPCGIAQLPCKQGTFSCVGGTWTTVCVGEIRGGQEDCDGVDDDCDGTPDNGGDTLCTSGRKCAGKSGCVECVRSADCPQGYECASNACKKVARCGDSATDTGEQCDDGNQSNADNCTTECKLNICGDRHWKTEGSGAELCDIGDRSSFADGRLWDKFSCDSSCRRLYIYTPCSGTGPSSECGSGSCNGGLCQEACSGGEPSFECNSAGRLGVCYPTCLVGCNAGEDCPSTTTCRDAPLLLSDGTTRKVCLKP